MAQMLYMPEEPKYSRPWWTRQLKNLGWVVLVTVLVWVYADMEFTDEMEFTATVRLVAPPDQLALLDTREGQLREVSTVEQEVTFRMRGSRGSLERFRTWLDTQQRAIAYDLSDRYSKGRRTYSPAIGEIVTSATPSAEYGLAFVSASEDTVTATMEERIRRMIPVTFVPRSGMPAGEPTIQPSEVAVLASVSTWQAITAEAVDTPTIQATRDLKDIEPGKEVTVTARVIPELAGIGVIVSPETVDVTLKVTVKDLPQRMTLKAIVRLQMPHTWASDDTWSEYRFEANDDFWWQKEITVSGPRAEIDKLRARQKDVDAYIELRDDDKDKGFISKTVNVRIPEDINVEIIGSLPTVQVRMAKRNGEE
jgi:hypothetical protein